jgi:branched-chain amino acid transport system permease protein
MDYLFHIGIVVAIYVILGLTLNLVVGYTGLLSLSHASFFGIGAYVTAIATTQYGMNFFVSLPIGIVIAGLTGLLIAALLSRLRDEQYALASFGCNTIIFSIFLGWPALTGGPLGITGISKPELFGFIFDSKVSFFILCAAIAVVVYGIVFLISRSSFGRTLQAIRDDEHVARLLGHNTPLHTLVIFSLTAGIAAVAGSLFASYVSYIEPGQFDIMESIFILAIVILGGMANICGTVLGALLLVVLPELIRFIGFSAESGGHLRLLIFGLSLVVLMLFRPQGLIGRYRL